MAIKKSNNQSTDTAVNLAVYMERLDSYIASQTALNDTLKVNLDSRLAASSLRCEDCYDGDRRFNSSYFCRHGKLLCPNELD